MRIAIVVQRYGESIVGGAERHCRLLAEKLAGHHKITVLTTCATDYRTWANELPAGTHLLNGVTVIRWPVTRQRHWRYFGWKSKRLFSSRHSVLDEYRWIAAQGPECPDLIEYLWKEKGNFDLFLFFTYLYYPTFFGLQMVAEKAILIPTAHDEPAIHLASFSSVFHLPRFIAFNSEEERRMVHTLFRNDYIPSAIIGVGIDIEPISSQDDGYLLYAGRLEKGKNCEELFEFVRGIGVPLKVIGHTQIPIPDHVEYLGFVSEARKREMLAGCRALVQPSRNESLSLAVLEAWAHAKPVIVSAHSRVLRSHVQKSGGAGYLYQNEDDFRRIANNVDSSRGLPGRKYVEENYSWAKVLQQYDHVFSVLTNHKRECLNLR